MHLGVGPRGQRAQQAQKRGVGSSELGGGRERDQRPVVVQEQEQRVGFRAGIAYSPENRKTDGIIGELTVRENINLALQAERGWLRATATGAPGSNSARAGSKRSTSGRQTRSGLPARFPGGNQQKVLLARLLALAPRLLVLDEPTRGIDIGAKVEIQRLVSELASTGMSVVFISAELEEVMRVGQRIAVLRDQQVVAILDSGRGHDRGFSCRSSPKRTVTREPVAS